jgi:predicted ATP-dependent endonuclease of OLD family
MQIKLTSLSIENYKSIKSDTFRLSDYTALVGYNNAGKSNILDACYWLLRKSTLQNEDFNDPAQAVSVVGVIDGITTEVLDTIHPNHRKSIEPYIVDQQLWIQRRQASPGGNTTNIKLNVRKINEDGTNDWVSNPGGIDVAIKNLFPEPIQIKAMDNAEEDVGKFKTTTTIGKLIKEIITPIEKKYSGEVADAMNKVSAIFGADGEARAEELSAFDRAANEKLGALFPDVNIKLDIPTPKVDDFFKSGTIKVYERAGDEGKDIRSMGTGAQRSIQMALIRQLAEAKQGEGDGPTRTLLLIDEPELYLHPQAIEQVRAALKALSKEGYQVLFSTHSPIMVTQKDVHAAILVRKCEEKGTYCRKRIEDAVNEVIKETPKQLEMIFELGNSSQILFSERVILAEGKTERKVLPALFEAITGNSFGYHRCALVVLDGAGGVHKAMRVLNAMDMPVKAVVDLDFAFKNALQGGYLERADKDLIACMNVFETFEQEGNVILEKGFPTKRGVWNASEAFARMATHEEGIQPVQNLHDKLKAHNVWLWKQGTIEVPCGLDGKDDSHWLALAQKLKHENYKTVLPHWQEVEQLVNWLTE